MNKNIRFKYRCVEALLRSDRTQQYQHHKKTKENWRRKLIFLYFYLRRIEGKHFKFVYEIRYNDMGKDKIVWRTTF